MKVSLVFLSLVCIYYSRSAQAQLRHIGGKDVSINTYPFMAAISYAYNHVGNGAIIDTRWILTSASAVYFLEESLYYVQVGTSQFLDNGYWYEVNHIHKHPEFIGWDYNIALIHLKGNIKYNNMVQPINLPVTDADAVKAQMLSFGLNEHATHRLREADYMLTADDACVNFLGYYLAKDMIKDKQGYCVFPIPGAQQGQFYSDAGAPLIADGQLFGLFAFAEHEGGINQGSVATRVFKFTSWIQEKIIKIG
ncbi:chymotrypsin-1-like [Anopheles marshallii]|uniref:chymotrypsin-1-like n=1 Tax=Anopheles marshallii TaxID=1521116 RepID=UPI00237B05F4|nr:chymotrypsin-1-like [Anopheles marshallii]